jgi:hypothetical protein
MATKKFEWLVKKEYDWIKSNRQGLLIIFFGERFAIQMKDNEKASIPKKRDTCFFVLCYLFGYFHHKLSGLF